MSVVTVTPTVEIGTNPPRVRLDVSDAGLPGYTRATVMRNDPNGESVPVRTPDGSGITLATSGANRVGVVYDYEVPYGQSVTYTTSESPTVVSAAVVADVPVPWLIHLGVPELSIPVDLGADSFEEEVRTVARGIYYPMGRETPVVFIDGSRKSAESSMTALVETAAEWAAMRAMLQDGAPLLLNVNPSLGFDVATAYVSIGDVRRQRPSGLVGSDPFRRVVLPYVVVDRPAGGTQAERTMLDLLVYPTLAQLAAAYPNLAAVLAGP